MSDDGEQWENPAKKKFTFNKSKMILPKFKGYTAIILGTGPSMTTDVVDLVRKYTSKRRNPFKVFGINNTFQLDVHINVFFACNPEWWDHYHDEPRMYGKRAGSMECWTWDINTARRYDLNWIEGRWSGGKRNVTSLSTDPTYIHYGHGAGYEVCGVAYHHGCRHFILAGYDLTYGRGYNSRERKIGDPRHFFGEYPKNLEHFPKTGKDGEMTGLLDCYRTIDTQSLELKITNTSPNSALDFFDVDTLERQLHEIYTASV